MIVEQLLNGLTLGMVYALIAVGYSMVFGILRLVNFSHGSVYAFGAFMAWMAISMFHWNVWIALIFSIIITGLLAVGIDKISLAPLRKKGSSGISSLITTVGMSFIIQNMLMIIYGSERQSFPAILDFGRINIGSLSISSQQIAITLVSLILLLGLTLIIKKTNIGLAMRSVEQNSKAAALNGVNVNGVIAFTFFIGGASAAIAGTLIGGYYQLVYPTMGVLTALKAFAAAVLGGIGVLHGSVVGGLVVGVAESFAASYLGGGYKDAIAFVILFLVLIIRPQGIFGKKGVTKV